jgi:type I restriction-modification system DNA methylase subunit
MSATIQTEIDKQKQRGRTRVKQTGEVFTPLDLCERMVREIPEDKLSDPNAKFLDNSCGDGNFLVTLLKVLSEYHDPQHVLNEMIYGVDLMEDNVATAKKRLGLTPEDKGWHHIVCANGLEYDYTFETPSE